MAQMLRCPLTGGACGKSIEVVEKTFFLAEPEKPEEDRKRRWTAIREAFGDKYELRSALEEERLCAFTCKICEMIQCCAYGIVDITTQNPNVILELGIMMALGKPAIILCKRGKEGELKLPSDLRAIGVIPFEDYIDILEPLRQMTASLPPPFSPPTPIAEIEKLSPPLAEELSKKLDTIVEEFDRLAKEAKLESIPPREEKLEISSDLKERLDKLEESLRILVKLGFTTDAKTTFYMGNYYYDRQQYKAALAQYDLYLTLKPDDPTALYNRGTIYHKLERYDEALADHNKALELRPDDEIALSNRGATYAEMERYDEALADVNRAIELRPDDEMALSNRGIIYSKLERYGEALTDVNRAIELRPDYPAAVYNKSCIFSLMHKPKDAIAFLEKAIGLDEKYHQKAATDSDFDNIRDDPRFKKLIEMG